MSTNASRLNLLRAYIKLSGVPKPSIAALARIDVQRLSDLATAKYEPWLSEAAALARVLGTDGITPLITSGNLTDCDLGIPFETDLDMLKAGVKMTLGLACRIAVKLGLDDPSTLLPGGRHSEIVGAMLERINGRECPFCVTTHGHGDRCLPALIYGPRTLAPEDVGALVPRLEAPGKARTASNYAPGLMVQRLERGLTREQVVQGVRAFGGTLNTSYLAQLEQQVVPLTTTLARKIATAMRVDVALFYVVPRDASGNPIEREDKRRGYGLKTLREEHGLRQIDMAHIIGCTSDTYAKMERCQTHNLPRPAAEKLASHFRVEFESLYATPVAKLSGDA